MKNPLPCGCRILGKPHYRELTIEYCPLHRAAPELLRILKYLVDLLDNWVSTGTIMDTKDGAYEQAKAAILAAEGTP